jgi:hypothetical protein
MDVHQHRGFDLHALASSEVLSSQAMFSQHIGSNCNVSGINEPMLAWYGLVPFRNVVDLYGARSLHPKPPTGRPSGM